MVAFCYFIAIFHYCITTSSTHLVVCTIIVCYILIIVSCCICFAINIVTLTGFTGMDCVPFFCAGWTYYKRYIVMIYFCYIFCSNFITTTTGICYNALFCASCFLCYHSIIPTMCMNYRNVWIWLCWLGGIFISC